MFGCSDEGVCFALQKGVEASRSVVKFFKHNDTDDLERLLRHHAEDEMKVGGNFGLELLTLPMHFTFTFMRLWPGSIRREWPGSGAVRAFDKK